MKTLFVLILFSTLSAHAEGKGCYAYGKSYEAGQEDCDGRVCGEDGVWRGVVKSGTCDLQDDSSREPSSVKKHAKKKHFKKKKKHSKAHS